MRSYERQRQMRTARAQRAARRNGTVFHMSGVMAALRGLALIAMGGRRLVARYDWLYGWSTPLPSPPPQGGREQAEFAARDV
jgi:salicylate hydroxylase